jgi:cytochrome P450
LLPQTLEEVLRFRSPVQSMYRVSVAETVLGDQRIPAGEPIVAWIGSANRDEQQFQRPAEFDIDRTPNRHLAFGHGIHFCLGAPLARLEAAVALSKVTARFPQAEMAGEPQYKPNLTLRGLGSLEVAI